jgi:hypothetical protein
VCWRKLRPTAAAAQLPAARTAGVSERASGPVSLAFSLELNFIIYCFARFGRLLRSAQARAEVEWRTDGATLTFPTHGVGSVGGEEEVVSLMDGNVLQDHAVQLQPLISAIAVSDFPSDACRFIICLSMSGSHS